ncbi:MAG TPA: PfkB family carbohydrate kinase, partial [Candidatus Binatus sp.]|nr:PfkB family carbohydrate kinase [Candidatus Binatus sp.]
MTAPSASDVVVGLGQATVELLGVGPRSSEAVVELATFSIQSGGAVGTTLATVAALGGRARYFGRLSDDEFGTIVLRGLKEFGVDVSQVLIEPGKVSPGSFVMVDERTGRRLARFTRGSTTPIDPGELPRNLLDGARV